MGAVPGPGGQRCAGGYCGLVDVVGGYGAALRWDLQEILGLDLDDWLTGQRDWRTLFEFLGRLRRRSGTASQAEYLADPEVVAELIAREEAKEKGEIEDEDLGLPLEGFGSIESRMARLEDRLVQLIHATLRVDMTGAEMAPRPEYPHIAERERIRREGMRAFELRLIPGGE